MLKSYLEYTSKQERSQEEILKLQCEPLRFRQSATELTSRPYTLVRPYQRHYPVEIGHCITCVRVLVACFDREYIQAMQERPSSSRLKGLSSSLRSHTPENYPRPLMVRSFGTAFPRLYTKSSPKFQYSPAVVYLTQFDLSITRFPGGPHKTQEMSGHNPRRRLACQEAQKHATPSPFVWYLVVLVSTLDVLVDFPAGSYSKRTN